MFNTKQSESENSKQTRIIEPARIQTNKEYESLVPPMTKEAFESLMSSIHESGQLEPITINNEGEVLDGHHRLRACEKLHFEPIFEVKTFDNPLNEKLYTLQRRQQICTLGRVNEKIAKDSGVSARQVSKVETILEKADPRLKDRVLNGTTKIDKAYKQIKNEERRLKLIAETKLSCAAAAQDNNPSFSNRIKLLQGDMRKLAYDAELIPDSSIDLIFTDPLYHREYLSLFVNLAEIADRVLKDGGSLVTYIGQYALPETLDYLRQPKTRLRYRHLFCIKLEGPQFGRLGNPIVFVKWKPLLWFVKGEKPQGE